MSFGIIKTDSIIVHSPDVGIWWHEKIRFSPDSKENDMIFFGLNSVSFFITPTDSVIGQSPDVEI